MHPLAFAPTPTLAAVSTLDALPHLAGMVMVMVTLAILWGICSLTAKIVGWISPATSPPAPAPIPAPKSPAPTAPVEIPESIAPEIVAVIAAAVASTTRQPCRIISIRPTSTSWERAGRQSVLTSHRIR